MVAKAANINVHARSYKHVRGRSDVEDRGSHRVFDRYPYGDWYIIWRRSVGDGCGAVQTEQ
jgi:hypothetical protein